MGNELFLKLLEVGNCPARNLPNHAWAGPDTVTGNALHMVEVSTFAMFIQVLYVRMWPTRSVFPSYKGMVNILKFFRGMAIEILVEKGDYVSDKTS